MDESTFETFEEELGDAPQPKPPRQSRRPDSFRIPASSEMYPQRRVREEPLGVQHIPRSQPREAPTSRGGLVFDSSRTVALRKSLSIQNVAQIEAPWEGVTLNRCLFIAITILVLSSGCQRLHEFLRGRKVGSDFEPMETALNVRLTAVRGSRIPAPEPETSLWDTFFWWVGEDEDDDDDDDDDDEGDSRRGRSHKKMKTTGGLRHKAITDRSLLKEREDGFKARRNKARQDEAESQENVRRLRKKKPEGEGEEEREEQEEKVTRVTSRKSKKKSTSAEKRRKGRKE